MEDNESPWRTLYVAGIALADPRPPLPAVVRRAVVRAFCGADVAAGADVAGGADAVACWLTESSTAVCAVAASATCGDKQRAAATVARVGAAAAVAPCGSWIRDGLRWRPKGLPSAKFALTGKYAGLDRDLAGSLEAPVSSRLRSLSGHLSRTGENGSAEQPRCYSAQPRCRKSRAFQWIGNNISGITDAQTPPTKCCWPTRAEPDPVRALDGVQFHAYYYYEVGVLQSRGVPVGRRRSKWC
jgi:hypothetical protein